MKCNRCGTVFHEGVFCPECGTKVIKPTDTSEKKKEEKPGISFEEQRKIQQLELEKEKYQKELELELKRKESARKWKQQKTKIVIIIAVILVLFIAFCCGGNDKGQSTEKKAEKDSIKETTQVQEVSGYIDMSEDELLQKLNMDKNDTGFYPDDDNINFTCIDGKVYSISLSNKHENQDQQYSLFGIKVGDSIGKIEDNLPENLQYAGTSNISDAKSDSFVNKENGYALAIDYNLDEIAAISYVADTSFAGDVSDDQTESDENTINYASELVYGIYENNSENYVCNAEVGYYTGDDEDYIELSGKNADGQEITEEMILYKQEDGSYLAKSDTTMTEAIVTFGDELMNVAITNAGDSECLNGTYTLVERTDMNN